MLNVRKLVTVTLSGLAIGATLGAAAPPKTASAFGCKCDDSGTGGYYCNTAQTACYEGGSEKCTVTCSEE